ncbi:hypothetical protein R5R35_013072 [Gryllus longicercus]|uniref:Uncharacterized protein n=1 Tax=Gryllus longicercus TaxID=2509291 RepID=A0AAN9V2U0_9ORTH
MKQQRRAAGALARWGADALLSACVVAPLVVGHWRGCWMLLELYGASAWGTFAGGGAAHAAVVLARDWLNRLSPGRGAGPYERLRFLVARRLYTALFGLACIAHWHGGWAVLDAFPRAKPWVVGASGTALLATRTLRNTLAPPYVVIADHARCAFLFPTMFRVDRSRVSREAAGSRQGLTQAGTATREARWRSRLDEPFQPSGSADPQNSPRTAHDLTGLLIINMKHAHD